MRGGRETERGREGERERGEREGESGREWERERQRQKQREDLVQIDTPTIDSQGRGLGFRV
jgi:hypothetical protein